MAEVIRPSAESVLLLVSDVDLEYVPDEKGSDWVRWTYASVHKHFDDRKGDYTLYLEGDERTMQDEAEFAELRIDGPFILQPAKELFYLDIEINVLIQTHIDPKDLYKIHKAVDIFIRAFENAICVYRFGDGDFDTGTLLGTYKLNTDLRETVDVNHYGIVKDDVRITQTTIEGHYRLELWIGDN